MASWWVWLAGAAILALVPVLSLLFVITNAYIRAWSANAEMWPRSRRE